MEIGIEKNEIVIGSSIRFSKFSLQSERIELLQKKYLITKDEF